MMLGPPTVSSTPSLLPLPVPWPVSGLDTQVILEQALTVVEKPTQDSFLDSRSLASWPALAGTTGKRLAFHSPLGCSLPPSTPLYLPLPSSKLADTATRVDNSVLDFSAYFFPFIKYCDDKVTAWEMLLPYHTTSSAHGLH